MMVHVPQNMVNIGPSNGLLPDGTKQLHEPILTSYQWGTVAFTRQIFHSECPYYSV